jgi:hypothetical protein
MDHPDREDSLGLPFRNDEAYDTDHGGFSAV